MLTLMHASSLKIEWQDRKYMMHVVVKAASKYIAVSVDRLVGPIPCHTLRDEETMTMMLFMSTSPMTIKFVHPAEMLLIEHELDYKRNTSTFRGSATVRKRIEPRVCWNQSCSSVVPCHKSRMC